MSIFVRRQSIFTKAGTNAKPFPLPAIIEPLQMTTYNPWKTLIQSMLLRENKFRLISTHQVNQTLRQVFAQDFGGDKETEIEVGYLDDSRLISLSITNPKTPGYNIQQQLDYYYNNDFDESKNGDEVGLSYTEANRNGITDLLSNGLEGRELKYYSQGRHHFSQIEVLMGYPPEVVIWKHDFVRKNLWMRLLDKFFKKELEFTIREINLKDIFPGVQAHGR